MRADLPALGLGAYLLTVTDLSRGAGQALGVAPNLWTQVMRAHTVLLT